MPGKYLQKAKLSEISKKFHYFQDAVQIRRMSGQDIDKIVEMGSEAPGFKTGTGAEQFYRLRTLRKWIRDRNGVTLVAMADGNLVGFVLGHYMAGSRDGYLSSLIVDERYRSIGAGSSLLKAALKQLRRKGCNHVFGVVKADNQQTLNFFEKNGFEIGGNFRYIDTMLP